VPDFQPRNLIDRNAEQELFRQLASFTSPARVLTICDKGGWGKSSLLKRLKYNCQYELDPPVAVCLIELNDLGDVSEFALVLKIVDELTTVGELTTRERFARFDELDNARMDRNAAAFSERGGHRVMATARAGTVAEGAVVAGINVQQADTVFTAEAPEFTPEQARRAERACVQAFFDDLREVCATQPVALLFDAWERCNSTLRDWILDEFLRNHALHPDSARRPDKLGVVVAGRPYDPASSTEGLRPDEFRRFFRSQEEMEASVLSVASLSEWEEDHISQFMVLNGLSRPTAEDIQLIKSSLRRGLSLEKIRTFVKWLADQGGGSG